MINRKIMYGGLLSLFVVLFASVAFVSGFFHDNEPDLSPFDATVQLANTPPLIVHVFPVEDVDASNTPVAGSPAGDVQPLSGTVVYSVVKFLAEDPNSAADLPDAGTTPVLSVVTFGSPTGTAGEIAVRVTSPVNGILAGAQDRDAVTGTFPTGVSAACVATPCTVGNTDCNDGAGNSPHGAGVSANQKEYTCYVQMQYFDEPSVNSPPTAGDDMWGITLYVEDISGNSDSAVSSDFVTLPFDAADEPFYMDYLTVSDIVLNPGESVTWAGVSVSATDLPADDNDAGDANGGLTFDSIGNTIVQTIDLTPQDLTGNLVPTAILEAESMSVGLIEGASPDVGACEIDDPNAGGGSAPFDGTALAGNTQISAFAFSIPFTATGTDSNDLFFCIWSQLDSLTNCAGSACLSGGATDAAYSATDACGAACDAAGEQWEVVFNS